jgi:hypothetical protein
LTYSASFSVGLPRRMESDHCTLHIKREMSTGLFDWTFGPGFAYCL